VKIYLRIALICFLNIHFGLFSQNESNNWYFGSAAGLRFNSGIASANTDYSLYQNEGCSSISDSLGKLLFYTDGQTVKDKNHNFMWNGFGLMGSSTSTQSALSLQLPGSDSLYYIFTVDDEFGPNGFRYNIVDMSLQGGLGEVITLNSNVNSDAREKLTAVKHQNGVDFWIITQKFGSNEYHSYLFSSTGLNTTPVISTIGAYTSGNDGLGYLSASITGNKLASAKWGLNIVELFSFNRSTGAINGLKTLTNVDRPYGVEFSPNERFLYVSESDATGSNVYQYDLQAGSANNIELSQTLLDTFAIQLGALQLAPDYKIYLAKYNDDTLGVINQPDSLGLLCAINLDGVDLLGRQARLGLPNLPKALLPTFKYTSQCFGDSTIFTLLQNNFDSVLWNFGDTSSVNNISLDINPNHSYSDTGIYTVTLTAYSGNNVSIKKQSLYISLIPSVNLTSFNPDSVCSNTNPIPLPTGSPLGGYYSGSGVINNDFDPAIAGQGYHPVVYSYINNYSCKNQDTSWVYVDVCTGVSNVQDEGINLYPNPTRGTLTVEIRANSEKINLIQVLGANGQLILKKVISGNQNIEIDMSRFSNGAYYLQLISNDKTIWEKILKY
jgi:hypothetical protein